MRQAARAGVPAAIGKRSWTGWSAARARAGHPAGGQSTPGGTAGGRLCLRYTAKTTSTKENPMSAHVYKLVELAGSSTVSTDDAIRNAIETAAKTLRHMDWFEATEIRGHIVDGKIAHYQVKLKVGFRIEN
jgi:flavin-binding protein dodecin